MELQPGDFSLRGKYQRNVVAAVVSTGTRWIGWKARPLLRIWKPGLGSACVTGYGSEDDVSNRRKRKHRAGRPANALRTTRSTLAILRNDAALLSLSQNESAREQNPRTRSICHCRHYQKRNCRRQRRAHC